MSLLLPSLRPAVHLCLYHRAPAVAADLATCRLRPRPLAYTAVAAAAGEDDVASREGLVDVYRRARLSGLENDRNSVDPVFSESYPRLTHGPNPIPIPVLRKIYHDVDIGSPAADRYVTVYGRVRGMRCHSDRLIFLDIVNEFQTIQIMLNFKRIKTTPGLTRAKLQLWTRLVAIGDHLSVTGQPGRSSTGELTVLASQLPQLLAPALEPIPNRLTRDRMARRHLDLLVNRESTDILRLKSHITKHMRDFFHLRRYTEHQTPILAEYAGGASARPFVTSSTVLPSRELQLRVAPELWLKRLVIGGIDKVFEIGPVFRNEAVDATHNPEFTMCEFYSAYTTLEDLIVETEDLLSSLAVYCKLLADSELTTIHPPDLNQFARPFRRVAFIPELERALGFRLPNLTAPDAMADLHIALSSAHIPIPGGTPGPTTLPGLLDRLAGVYLEPLSRGTALFITHHPACMTPLAKSFLCPDTLQLVSARTELFFNTREIANMYEEENDPARQQQKLEDHRRLATLSRALTPAVAPSLLDYVRPLLARLGLDGARKKPLCPPRPPRPADRHRRYIYALNAGLPPTGGWGCGVERLVMLFSGANRLGDCFTFGNLRHVVGAASTGPPAPSDRPDSTSDTMS